VHSHDPIYDVQWIQSRSGNECCSVSTDGQLLWWDVRKLSAGPTDSMMLAAKTTGGGSSSPKAGGGGASDKPFIYGGTSLEYKSDAGATRYLVGTEQGRVLLCDRKAKKDMDSQKTVKATYGLDQRRHHGPVYSIQRNPLNLKYFLTIGDWTARLWMEDLRGPILTTKYDNAYLTAGCWSPTRPGVFFTTKVSTAPFLEMLYFFLLSNARAHAHTPTILHHHSLFSSLTRMKVHTHTHLTILRTLLFSSLTRRLTARWTFGTCITSTTTRRSRQKWARAA
jgi:dynein intermediate chain 2